MDEISDGNDGDKQVSRCARARHAIPVVWLAGVESAWPAAEDAAGAEERFRLLA